jgi:hypothetical protein
MEANKEAKVSVGNTNRHYWKTKLAYGWLIYLSVNKKTHGEIALILSGG